MNVAEYQLLICYDGPNQTGAYIQTEKYNINAIPDLSDSFYDFDNKIVSCRMYGIFVFYEGYNYNSATLNVSC